MVLPGQAGAICLMIVCIGAALPGCEQNPPPPPSTAALVSTSEFQFAVPPGWRKVPPDRDKTAAMMLLNGTSWQDADGIIKVDVGNPAKTDPMQHAMTLAGADGRVLEERVLINGLPAIQVETKSSDMARPRHAVVVQREGKIYLILAATATGTELTGALNHMIDTWRWVD